MVNNGSLCKLYFNRLIHFLFQLVFFWCFVTDIFECLFTFLTQKYGQTNPFIILVVLVYRNSCNAWSPWKSQIWLVLGSNLDCKNFGWLHISHHLDPSLLCTLQALWSPLVFAEDMLRILTIGLTFKLLIDPNVGSSTYAGIIAWQFVRPFYKLEIFNLSLSADIFIKHLRCPFTQDYSKRHTQSEYYL